MGSFVHELGILDVPDGAQQTADEVFGLAATFANGLVDNGSRDIGAVFGPPFLSRRQHSGGMSFNGFLVLMHILMVHGM